MKCLNCGTEIPAEATFCPRCGTTTSNYAPNPTLPSYSASEPKPPTWYGSGPYGEAPQQDPYGQYNIPLQAPPPPPAYTIPSPLPPIPPSSQRRRGPNVGIIIGVAVLVLVLIGAGLFALLRHGGSNTPSSVQSSPTTTNGVSPTATSNIAQNPYPPNTGTLVLDDPMHDNSKGYKWDEATITNGGTCGFTAGVYHIHPFQAGLVCVPEASNLVFSNVVFEVRLTITQGDQAAVVLRLNQTNVDGYYFFITIQGNYILCSNTCNKPLSSGLNNAINKGQNQSNLVALIANGSTISAYVNGQFVASANDKANTQGQIGIESASSSGPGDVIATTHVSGNCKPWSKWGLALTFEPRHGILIHERLFTVSLRWVRHTCPTV